MGGQITMEVRTKNFIKFNAHPKGLSVKDCVVRAVSTAFEKDYMKTSRELNRVKKELGYSSYKDRKFLYDYLASYDRLLFKGTPGQPRTKVVDFLREHPQGTFIVSVRGHVTTVRDGYLVDS
jgi:hypothetical protein